MRLKLSLSCRLAVLALSLLAFPGYAQTAQADANPDGTVSLNFVDADIESVINAIGKISGKNFLIDPRVKGTLNIVTNTPLSRELSYQVLLSALRLQGFTAVDSGELIKILPEVDAKQHGVPVDKAGRKNGESLITRVFPMRHESAAQMLTVVRPLVSPNNSVTAFPSNNVLVITDYADNLSRIAQIIESVDVEHSGISVIELQYAVAMDLAETITKLLHEGGESTAHETSQQVSVIAEPRTNSLLIKAANPARLRSVRQLAASLDQPGAGGSIHVVYLKNAEAAKVAQTLNAALSGSQTIGQQTSTPVLSETTTNNTSDNMQSGNTFSALNETPGTATSGGVVQADILNNALIIVAPDAVYRNLRQVIDLLDRRRVQVFIEALIAEISSERAAEIGIQWQSATLPGSGSGGFGGTSFGSGGQNIAQLSANPLSLAGGLNFIIGRGTVQVPIDGRMVDVFNLGLLARFLESDARTNILSTPAIVTMDNEMAKIVVGSNVPFVTGQYTNAGAGAQTVNPFQTITREDVGLTLEVRPQISEGGTIKLEIYQETSSLASSVDSVNGPTTNKRSIRSTVLVDDGAIVALGGLVEDNSRSGEEKVPLLGDLPLAGSLFRYNTRKRAKTNLLVFLRPLIIRNAEDHDRITASRYEYIIGQQRDHTNRVQLTGEKNQPQLPPLAIQLEARKDGPAPVVDASVVWVENTAQGQDD